MNRGLAVAAVAVWVAVATKLAWGIDLEFCGLVASITDVEEAHVWWDANPSEENVTRYRLRWTDPWSEAEWPWIELGNVTEWTGPAPRTGFFVIKLVAVAETTVETAVDTQIMSVVSAPTASNSGWKLSLDPLTGTWVGQTTHNTDTEFGMYGEGDLSFTVTPPASGQVALSVLARGSPWGGEWPVLTVAIDDTQIDDVLVGVSEPFEYHFVVELETGPHKLSLGYHNDAYTSGEEDRNLWVGAITLKGIGASHPVPNPWCYMVSPAPPGGIEF